MRLYVTARGLFSKVTPVLCPPPTETTSKPWSCYATTVPRLNVSLFITLSGESQVFVVDSNSLHEGCGHPQRVTEFTRCEWKIIMWILRINCGPCIHEVVWVNHGSYHCNSLMGTIRYSIFLSIYKTGRFLLNSKSQRGQIRAHNLKLTSFLWLLVYLIRSYQSALFSLYPLSSLLQST